MLWKPYSQGSFSTLTILFVQDMILQVHLKLASYNITLSTWLVRLSLHMSQVAHQAIAYSDLCSLKWLGVFLLPPARLSLGFEAPVALFSTPIANLSLFGWILSTTGHFTLSIKGKSSVLSSNRCYGCGPQWQPCPGLFVSLLQGCPEH